MGVLRLGRQGRLHSCAVVGGGGRQGGGEGEQRATRASSSSCTAGGATLSAACVGGMRCMGKWVGRVSGTMAGGSGQGGRGLSIDGGETGTKEGCH